MAEARQTHLDATRGAAALLVVFAHFVCAFYPFAAFGGAWHSRLQAPWEKLLLHTPLALITGGHFAVCLFYILSGYVLSRGFIGQSGCRARVAAAAIKRPLRLGGMVLFTAAGGALLWRLNLLHNCEAAGVIDAGEWLCRIWSGPFDADRFMIEMATSPFALGTHYNPPLWTIALELYGSLMVYSLMLVCGASRWRWAATAALLAGFHGSLYQGFFIGLALADLHRQRPDVFAQPRPLAAIALVLLALGCASFPHYAARDYLLHTAYGRLAPIPWLGGGYPMLGALFTFLAVMTLRPLQSVLDTRPLQYLGRISYAIYGVHFPLLASLSVWLYLQFHALGHGIAVALVVSCSLPAMVIAADLTTRWVDAPSIRVAAWVGRRALALIESLLRRTRPHRAAAL